VRVTISGHLYIIKLNANIMATIKAIAPTNWAAETQTTTEQVGLWTKYLTFVDGQKENRTLWFFITLMVHGVILLPVPAVLMYYFNAPVIILTVTMACFFTNLIANMGGAGIRTTITCFFASLAIHAALILAFVL
jgi:hypothetical protein